MRRGEGERRLAAIEEAMQSWDDRLRTLAALERELAQIPNAVANGETWKTQAAENLVQQVQAEVSCRLNEAVSPAMRKRLEEAVLGGPETLGSLQAALSTEVHQAEVPRQQLSLLRLRLRCLELRRGCLQHLDTIFNASRVQP